MSRIFYREGDSTNEEGPVFRDGFLDGDAVVWVDPFGDELGVGAELVVEEPPEGAFTLTVTATDSDGNSVVAFVPTLVVAPAPSAPGTGAAPVAALNAPADATVDVAVGFSGSNSRDPLGEPITFAWDFGDGNTSTDINPTHTYAVTGTYIVALTVTDSEGLEDTATASITVDANGISTTGDAEPIDVATGDAVPIDYTILDTGNGPWTVQVIVDGVVERSVTRNMPGDRTELVTFDTPGIVRVGILVTDRFGNLTSFTRTFIVSGGAVTIPLPIWAIAMLLLSLGWAGVRARL